MVRRCTNPKDAAYSNYGGRGIAVYPEWLNYENFIQDVGKRPSDKHSLDRIDNDKGYYPDNIRWTTKSYQAHNRRKRKALYGAVWRPDKNKWLARIRKDGKAYGLGYYETELEAHEAYKRAEVRFFP
jgi:hypothetical protein